jgi:hypothetical protein
MGSLETAAARCARSRFDRPPASGVLRRQYVTSIVTNAPNKAAIHASHKAINQVSRDMLLRLRLADPAEVHVRNYPSTSEVSTPSCSASSANKSRAVLSVARSFMLAHSAATARSFSHCAMMSSIGLFLIGRPLNAEKAVGGRPLCPLAKLLNEQTSWALEKRCPFSEKSYGGPYNHGNARDPRGLGRDACGLKNIYLTDHDLFPLHPKKWKSGIRINLLFVGR